MSSALSVSKKAIKKAAKKGAGPPKKHAPHKNKERDKHESDAERRRAYLHLARASSLLAALPEGKAHNELNSVYSLCKEIFINGKISGNAAAEAARALEHLCFVSFAAPHSALEVPVTKALQRDFERHFRHDLEKQTQELEKAEGAKGPLLELAAESLANAEKMLLTHDWYLSHECLRAADALIKALEHL